MERVRAIEEVVLPANEKYKLYPNRWLIAILQCANSAMSAYILSTFIAIWFVAVDFFAMDNMGINMFRSIYITPYMICCIMYFKLTSLLQYGIHDLLPPMLSPLCVLH